MTQHGKISADNSAKVAPKTSGLDLLREPFPSNLISKLPKPTKRQTEEVKSDFKKGIRCKDCGQWHHPQVQHLDYVGHAALTDRLLDCDPRWNWEPVALSENGTPLLDDHGGMWIKLTVCGQTRLGYGHPDGKRGGDAIKEVIGDALRNAAMRFGAALDLWHKGDLHGDSEELYPQETQAEDPKAAFESRVQSTIRGINREKSLSDLGTYWSDINKTSKDVAADPRVIAAKDERKTALQSAADTIEADEIPY